MATASREWSTDEEEAVSEDNLFYEGYTDHSSAYPYTAVPDPVDYSREVRPRVNHAPRTPRTLPTQSPMTGITRGPINTPPRYRNVPSHLRNNLTVNVVRDDEERTIGSARSNNDRSESVMPSALRSPQQYRQNRKQLYSVDISSSIISPSGSRHDIIQPPPTSGKNEEKTSKISSASSIFKSKLESTSNFVRNKVQVLRRNDHGIDDRSMTENGFYTDDLLKTKSVAFINSIPKFYQEKFDFAILLSPDDDYAYWASALDFYPEATGCETSDDNVYSPAQVLDSIHNDGQCLFRPSIFEKAVDEVEGCLASQNDGPREDDSRMPYEDLSGFNTPTRRGTLATSQSTRRRMTEALLRRGSTGTLLSPNSTTPKRMFRTIDGNVPQTPTDRDREQSTPLKPAGSATKHTPRGIAARAKQGELEVFLQAMSHGFVVKRHRPNASSTFVKLFSEDGGDSIQYALVSEEEAIIALNEQRIRYNQNRKLDIDQFRCRDSCHDHREPFLHINKRHKPSDLPDHLLAQTYRDETSSTTGSLLNIVKSTLKKNWDKFESSGSIKAADIIDVHPSTKLDPFFTRHPSGKVQGTSSLRESPDDYCPCNTFSIVMPSLMLTKGKNTIAASDEFICQKWYGGRGNPNRFNYMNFETATEGEFWVILRGFLRLHRDAASNRFASERACGIGSHFARQQVEEFNAKEKEQRKIDSSNGKVGVRVALERPNATIDRSPRVASSLRKRNKESSDRDIESNPSHQFFHSADDDDENVINEKDSTLSDRLHLAKQVIKTNVSAFLQKSLTTLEKSKTVYNDKNLELASNFRPPPSDYFLGFKSSGTQIWARLRQAGLETQRIYGLDTSQVMLLIRCPEDRLQDVAEVVRLRLRTQDGLNLPPFLPFRESHSHIFLPSSENNDTVLGEGGGLFCSNDRQFIINFILHSNLQDTGAQIGPRSQLGRSVTAHVPLHNYERLQILSETWISFWKRDAWLGRDGRSMGSDKNKAFEIHPGIQPNFFYRMVIGAFYQPLDSIEQYYGSNVAFYFAWLQHCAAHLVPLSIIGFFVFIVQLNERSWDHWTRLPFSVIVMIWSFIVMVNWRKRSKYLAYRWGTLNYEEEESTRPQFKGSYKRMPDPGNPKETVFVRDPITNELVFNNPWWKRAIKFSISIILTAGVTLGIFILILIFNANRDILIARYFDEENEDGDNFTWDFSARVIGQASTGQAIDVTQKHVSDPYFWLIMLGFPLILGIFLPLLNNIFWRVALLLNDFENYKTETEYRNFLILKVFAFRFVCYFATLYYYAFVTLSGFSERNDHGFLASENAVLRIVSSLVIFVTVAHWWMIFATVYLPSFFHKLKASRKARAIEDKSKELAETELLLKCSSDIKPSCSTDTDQSGSTLSHKCSSSDLPKDFRNGHVLLSQAMHPIWNETNLPVYNSFADYIYAIIMFAYVTCFSVVLPITPFFILINTLLSMRVDAYKLCHGRRRPLAARSSGIGVWEHVLHIVTVIAVLTNCALIAVTSNLFGWLSESVGSVGVVFICIVWEHVMLLIKYIIQSSMNKLPKAVIDAMKEEKIKAARRRNESLVYRHRRSKSCLYDDHGISHNSNEAMNTSSPQSKSYLQPLSTILSNDDVDEPLKSNKDFSTMENKENLPLLPIPKAVPEETDDESNYVASANNMNSPDNVGFIEDVSPKQSIGVKRIIHKIEKQQSMRGIQAPEPNISRNMFFTASEHPKSPMSTTPIKNLQMKKTRITPPRTGHGNSLQQINPFPMRNHFHFMVGASPSSNSHGFTPTPRELKNDLSYEASSKGNSPTAPPFASYSGPRSINSNPTTNTASDEISEITESIIAIPQFHRII